MWRFKKYDYVALIPVWTFFAPNPGTRDYNVLYRHKLETDSYTHWRQLVENDPPITRAIWNPDKRTKKAISDFCVFFRQSLSSSLKKQQKDVKRLLVSVPYLGLASAVSSLTAAPMSEGVQFMIVWSYGYYPERAPDILFVSQVFACR